MFNKACSLVFVLILSITTQVFAEQSTNIHDRVVNTSTLRCGYVLYPPYFDKDLKTGAFKGVAYDLVMAIAKQHNLKVEWTEEVFTGQEIAVLDAWRVDAVCAAEATYNPDMFMRADFTDALFYIKNDIYARADDPRFQGAVKTEDLNKAAVSFAGIDGDSTIIYPGLYFPAAKRQALPTMSSPSQLFLELLGKKADLVMAETAVADYAIRSNPDKFRRIDYQGGPLPRYGIAIALRKDSDRLLRSLNEAIEFMNANGVIDAILDSYDSSQTMFIRTPKPYQER